MDWHSRRDSLGYGTQENDSAIPQVWRVVAKSWVWMLIGRFQGTPKGTLGADGPLGETLYSLGRRCVYIFNRRKAKKEIPDRTRRIKT